MRTPRRKVQKAFGINNPHSEEFEKLLNATIIEQEMDAAYRQFNEGKDFFKFNAEMKMDALCEIFK